MKKKSIIYDIILKDSSSSYILDVEFKKMVDIVIDLLDDVNVECDVLIDYGCYKFARAGAILSSIEPNFHIMVTGRNLSGLESRIGKALRNNNLFQDFNFFAINATIVTKQNIKFFKQNNVNRKLIKVRHKKNPSIIINKRPPLCPKLH